VALVTAAANGIGRATAIAMADEGATVWATDIDEGGLANLRAERSTIAVRRMDVRRAADIEAVVAEAGTLDALVNCVGFVHHGTILECSEADWDRSFDLNVKSMYRTCRACLPAMLEAGRGSIVNVSSVASSVKGIPLRFVYGATKAAIIGLTKSLAADFVGKGIRANAICPGTVDTPSLDVRIRALGDPVTVRESFKARQPMGRLGRPEEVAALAVYLASDESSFTTGQVHIIDGGWIG
jgi:2-keto-3-deoxy-L-fuconate dehydrogenase